MGTGPASIELPGETGVDQQGGVQPSPIPRKLAAVPLVARWPARHRVEARSSFPVDALTAVNKNLHVPLHGRCERPHFLRAC